MTATDKTCKDCGEVKPASEFYAANNRTGLQPACKPCHKARSTKYHRDHPEKAARYSRAHFLRTKYGITPAEFDAMLDAQDGRCAVCDGPPVGRGSRLSVDHCHETGRVRGLLCTNCNSGLGRFKDDPDVVERAALYLRGTLSGCPTPEEPAPPGS